MLYNTTKPPPNANGVPSRGPRSNGRTIKPGIDGGAAVQDWTIDNRLRWACYMAEPSKEPASVRRLVDVLMAQRRMIRETALEVLGPPALLAKVTEATIEAKRRELLGTPSLRADRTFRRPTQGDSRLALQVAGA